MSDERTRDLERLAAQGDPAAIAALARARCRAEGHTIVREWLGATIVTGEGSRTYTIHEEDWRQHREAERVRAAAGGSGGLRIHTQEGLAALSRVVTVTAAEGHVFRESRCGRCGEEKRLLMLPVAEQCHDEGHVADTMVHQVTGAVVRLAATCARCGVLLPPSRGAPNLHAAGEALRTFGALSQQQRDDLAELAGTPP